VKVQSPIVAGRIPVLVDSGIRRRPDVLTIWRWELQPYYLAGLMSTDSRWVERMG
jgi:hypothetical protein